MVNVRTWLGRLLGGDRLGCRCGAGFSMLLVAGVVPRCWFVGVRSRLLKRGVVMDFSYFRGIVLSSGVEKLFERVVLGGFILPRVPPGVYGLLSGF